jgi:L-seryl-tRNA(Ser) seleniumtransferase
MADLRQDALRQLPAIGRLLQLPLVQGWLREHPEAVVTSALRDAVQMQRLHIEQGAADGGIAEEAVLRAADDLIQAAGRPGLRRVINATGIVLHTGLGRAPLAEPALGAIQGSAGRYSNLELDLDSGQRGQRAGHLGPLLCRLTGAQAATVVNNNAAATLLILNTLAGSPPLSKGRRRAGRPEVIVSRGQLIEIGGSFRLPDIMAASGVRLVEVGTTNRTRIDDYARAVTEHTAGLLRVHTSNYRVSGFTEDVSTRELVDLARTRGLPVIDDLGSGALVDLSGAGLREPVVGDSVRAGADLICFSGDKLLGGTQAGIIVGLADRIRAIEKNPLMRTYRVDKLTLLALDATLRLYLDPERARREIPALAMLHAGSAELEHRARRLAEAIKSRHPGIEAEVVEEVAYAGGGSLPDQELPGWAVRVTSKSKSARALAGGLRRAAVPIISRIHKSAVMLDVRTICDDEVDHIAAAFKSGS